MDDPALWCLASALAPALKKMALLGRHCPNVTPRTHDDQAEVQEDAPGLLRTMRRALNDSADFVVFHAALDGVLVAVMPVFSHGACATELLRWNGPAGRKVNAHNFLL
jgi:hypothetical protein